MYVKRSELSLFWALVLLTFLVSVSPFGAGAQSFKDSEVSKKLAKLIPKEKSKSLALVVEDLTSQELVFSHNGTKPLKPASVLKILTAAGALTILGPDYRFKTRIWVDKFVDGHVSTLYVVGSGDPALNLESLWILARKLKKLGVKSVGKIALDSSHFLSPASRSGVRAYQAGASAISFNYNSVTFEICPRKLGDDAIVTIDPWEAEIGLSGRVRTQKGGKTGVSIEEQHGKAKGTVYLSFQVSGSIAPQVKCKEIYRSVSEPEIYLGVTLKNFLQSIGVVVKGSIVRENLGAKSTLLYEHLSKPLSEIVKDLNHFSNNFIGEQLLYALGESVDGKFSREAGLLRLREYLDGLGRFDREIELADGSGLSHDNRITAQALSQVLRTMDENSEVGAEFENSLSVAARNGTLKKRFVGVRGLVLRGKTGSLNGVSSLAGYVFSRTGRRIAFVLLQNDVYSGQRADAFEEAVVKALFEVG